MWHSLITIFACIPALVLIAAVHFEHWRRKQRGERQPLKDKLLRTAGYTLQRKLEELNDSFMTWFMGTFLFSLGAIGAFQFTPADTTGRIMFFIMSVVGTAICTVVAWRRVGQMRNCRCGLIGEQAAAEELQGLVSMGFYIFHDIPGKDKWNIDHVAVGPSGVFAIETKYRTKRPGKDGGEDHKAVFDGKVIQFSSGNYETSPVEQARNGARWLAQELSKATGKRVTVQPIVALPGWYVTLKANSDVKVLSGKQVASFITKEPRQLSEAAIQQISYQLDQRCRTVEF